MNYTKSKADTGKFEDCELRDFNFMLNIRKKNEMKKNEKLYNPVMVLDEVFENPLSSVGKHVVASMLDACRNFKLLFNLKHCPTHELNVEENDTLFKKINEFKKLINLFEKDQIKYIFSKKSFVNMLSNNNNNTNSIFTFKNMLESKERIVALDDILTNHQAKGPDASSHRNITLKFDKLISFLDRKSKDNNRDDDSFSLGSEKYFQKDYVKKENTFKLPSNIQTFEVSKHERQIMMIQFNMLDSIRIVCGHSRKRLSEICKNLLRTLKKDNQVNKYVQNQKIKEILAVEFVEEFSKILKTTKRKLHMDVLEENVECLYLEYSGDRLYNYQKILKILLETKDKLKIEKDKKINEYETNIRNLKLQSITNQSVFNEYVDRLNNNKDNLKLMNDLEKNNFLEEHKAKNEMKKSKDISYKHWINELSIRKYKYKLKQQVQEAKMNCYKIVKSFQEQENTILQEVKAHKMALATLEKIYYPLEFRYYQVLQVRRNMFNQLRSKDILENRRLTAALQIQNWWRRYKIRKNKIFQSKKRLIRLTTYSTANVSQNT